MNDVIWAAIIAGGVGLAGNVTTYFTAKSGAAATVRTAEQAAAVELERINAENERLREQIRDDERRNRQGTYHRMIAVLDRLDYYATGYPPTDEQYNATVAEFNYLHGGILLFGPPSVTDAVGPLIQVLSEIGAGMAAAEGTQAERWRVAYLPRREDFIRAQGRLVAVMHADVTRGVLPE
jgi:hypothetical protein